MWRLPTLVLGLILFTGQLALAGGTVNVGSSNSVVNNTGLYPGVPNNGSFQIDITGGTGVPTMFGYTPNTRSGMQLYWRYQGGPATSGGQVQGLQVMVEAEAGGTNETGLKDTHSAFALNLLKRTMGQSYADWINLTSAGAGDAIGQQISVHSLGTSIAGGDEGGVGSRVIINDYVGLVTGSATFTGGGAPETLTPTGLSEYDLQNIGEGQLIVWTDNPTPITITNYNSTTRVWTYSQADQNFKGRCMAVDSYIYTSDGAGAPDSYVWLYIDSDGVGNFTTQLIGSYAGVPVGAPNDYLTGAQSTPARVAKACNRIAEVRADPNRDDNFADSTIKIAGADLTPGGAAFKSNSPEGSCSSNCNFTITGDPQATLVAIRAGVDDRKGTMEQNMVVDLLGSPDLNGRKPVGVYLHNGPTDNTQFTRGMRCFRSTDICIEHVTTVNGAQDETLAQVEIVNDSGTAGYFPLIKVYENFLGGSNERTDLRIAADVSGSSLKLLLGADATVGRPFVTAPPSGGAAGQLLAYDGSGDRNRGFSFKTNVQTICKELHVPGAGITVNDDMQSIWRAPAPATITEVYCDTTNSTVSLDLQIDDGSPAAVMGTDLVCDTSGKVDNTSLSGAMATGDRLDVAISAVGVAPIGVSVCANIVY